MCAGPHMLFILQYPAQLNLLATLATPTLQMQWYYAYTNIQDDFTSRAMLFHIVMPHKLLPPGTSEMSADTKEV